MKIRHLIILLALVSLISGCYMPISGRVIDVETNQPIEGAVVLVEWTVTKGYGLTYTESAKVAEKLSDKDGNFDLPGCYNPFVNKPDVTIYKKGYVVWNNEYIFPDYIKRADFKWESEAMFRIEKFKPEYSYDAHTSFIRRATNSTIGKKELIKNAYRWEELKSFEERKKTWNK